VGVELLETAMRQIISHPETWDQENWFCGTKACLAGHIVLAAGATRPEHLVEDTEYGDEVLYQGEVYPAARLARILTGIAPSEAAWLWEARRTMPELYEAVNLLTRDIALPSWYPGLSDHDGPAYVNHARLPRIVVHRRTVAKWDGAGWYRCIAPSRHLAHQTAAELAIAANLHPLTVNTSIQGES
jgi:hypothetical protein